MCWYRALFQIGVQIGKQADDSVFGVGCCGDWDLVLVGGESLILGVWVVNGGIRLARPWAVDERPVRGGVARR